MVKRTKTPITNKYVIKANVYVCAVFFLVCNKARVACTCIYNKCKCVCFSGRLKNALPTESKFHPLPFLIVLEDLLKYLNLLPKQATSTTKSYSLPLSSNPEIAAMQQKESMMNCFGYDVGVSSPIHTTENSMEDKICMKNHHA